MYFVGKFLDPLVGGADDDDMVRHYENYDPNDEQRMRQIIRREIYVRFSGWNTRGKRIGKETLRYALTTRESNYFERTFNSVLPPFPPPDDARLFFVWIWEELFGPEAYEIKDLSGYVENNDLHAPNLVRLPDKSER